MLRLGRTQPDTSLALSVTDLSYRVGSRFALESINFSVSPGEGVAIIGTNGAGKTTLIRLAAGLSRPDHGQVLLCGISPQNWGKASQHLGYVQQTKELPDGVTVATYLNHQLRLRNADPARYAELIAAASLGPYENQYVRTLSGGNQRKLHIVCAVAHRPNLLILDEPTVGLDPTAQEAVLELLRALKTEGVGVLFASHHLHELVAVADSVVVLHEGRQVKDTSLADILSSGDHSSLSLRPFTADAAARVASWAQSLPSRHPVISGVTVLDDTVRLELTSGEHHDALYDVVALARTDAIALRSIAYNTPNLAEIVRSFIAEDREHHR